MNTGFLFCVRKTAASMGLIARWTPILFFLTLIQPACAQADTATDWEALLKDGIAQPHTRGERVHAAVLFSDIRGFTTLSEALPPTELIALLNDYLSTMTDAVHEYQGTVVSFMGDGIMAIFGCPGSLECPEQNALEAAQDMLIRLREFNMTHPKNPLKIGIGIHSGEVMAGNVGSSSRYEFTVIGDVVNTSSRIEGLTKEQGYPILMSANVAKAVGMHEDFVDLGMVPVRGRSEMPLFGWKPKALETIYSSEGVKNETLATVSAA